MVKPIRSYVTLKFKKSWRKKQRMSLGMVEEYRPYSVPLSSYLSVHLGQL